jgi:hypothetical protein
VSAPLAAPDVCPAPVIQPVHAAHPLHAVDRIWPETNCYTDLLIELLHLQGHAPEAMLGFTLRQDFERDQFTFFKPRGADIEALYGLTIEELSVYEGLEAHALLQAARGVTVLAEVDAHYLPETAGVTYRRDHSKTTIGILALDPKRRELEYLHNGGRYRLAGEDYDGVFAPSVLPPYAEFVKRTGPALAPEALREAALAMLRLHRARAPERNPVNAFRAALAATAPALVLQPIAVFHRYAFNTTRQLGANFELLASHLAWLGLDEAAAPAEALAREAKTFQFQLARAFGRKVATGLADRLEPAIAQYDAVFAALDRAL